MSTLKKKAGRSYSTTVQTLIGSKARRGEIHAIHRTKHGLKLSKYSGPGSQVRSGASLSEPMGMVDKIALEHDLRYATALTEKEVRAADLNMIHSLNVAKQNRTDYKWNFDIAQLALKAKINLEDLGVPPQLIASWGPEEGEENRVPEYKRMLSYIETHDPLAQRRFASNEVIDTPADNVSNTGSGKFE